MANLELKTASGGSVTLVPEDGVSNVTATVKHESGVLASEAQVEQAEFLAGVGRTWQDVKLSRSYGVTYTNNTGRDIAVLVEMGGTSGGPGASSTMVIDGVIVGRVDHSNGQHLQATCFIIPNNSTYRVNVITDTTAFPSSGWLWWELR